MEKSMTSFRSIAKMVRKRQTC